MQMDSPMSTLHWVICWVIRWVSSATAIAATGSFAGIFLRAPEGWLATAPRSAKRHGLYAVSDYTTLWRLDSVGKGW
jgi:hypothetical protein